MARRAPKLKFRYRAEHRKAERSVFNDVEQIGRELREQGEAQRPHETQRQVETP
jgi:hypothetical protein